MTIIEQVEQEYGEPFWEVVRGYAADGYGCDTTAAFSAIALRHRSAG